MLSCIKTTSNKSERLMHLVGWFIWMYDDALTYKPKMTYPGRTTQKIRRTSQKLGRVLAVPRLCGFYPGIYLTTEEKERKNGDFLHSVIRRFLNLCCKSVVVRRVGYPRLTPGDRRPRHAIWGRLYVVPAMQSIFQKWENMLYLSETEKRDDDFLFRYTQVF
jgi:hypothetical protein